MTMGIACLVSFFQDHGTHSNSTPTHLRSKAGTPLASQVPPPQYSTLSSFLPNSPTQRRRSTRKMKQQFGKMAKVEVNIHEDEWLKELKSCLDMPASEMEDEVEKHSKSVVFNVPKELKSMKPDAFIPQLVAIGPYHHGRSELHEMERYKLVATKRFQDRLLSSDSKSFEDTVVAELKNIEWPIRICYDKYINCRGDTLAWLMAVDAIFVLECLQIFDKMKPSTSTSSEKEKREENEGSEPKDVKQLGRVFDPSAKTTTHMAVVKDLVMLENQIPLFVVQKLLELQVGDKDKAKKKLSRLLTLTLEQLCPFSGLTLMENAKAQPSCRGHLLEALYYAIAPPNSHVRNRNQTSAEKKAEEMQEIKSDMEKVVHDYETLEQDFPALTQIKPVKEAVSKVKIALSKLSRLRVFKVVKDVIIPVFSAAKEVEESIENNSSSASEDAVIEIPPTRDELTVPCVKNLHSAGVKFRPVEGDLTSVRLDEKKKILYLPKLRIDATTEVVLRNLHAFEGFVAPGGTMVFTRYMDFMNGIIDSVEDVKILKKNKVITHHLESDQEVANLWNSMGGCANLTKVGYLDKVIGGLNKIYSEKWSVKLMEMVQHYVYGPWQFMSLMAAVILLCLTALQSFCTVYDCQTWFDYSILKDATAPAPL